MNNLSENRLEVIDKTGTVIKIQSITHNVETAGLKAIVNSVVDSAMNAYLKPQIKPIISEVTLGIMSKCKMNLPKVAIRNTALESMTSALKVWQNKLNEIVNQNTYSVFKNFAEKIKKFYIDNQDVFEQLLFFGIANEIGFPIYIEVNSELQRELIHCYRQNGNQCDKEQMRKIIFEYYNDAYVDKIFLQIIDAGIFCLDRNELLFEAVYDYQIGSYGGAGAILATQFGGIIGDAYNTENLLCRFTSDEKQEIMDCFGMDKKAIKGDKGKAFLTMRRQQGVFGWMQIEQYFQEHLYSSKEDDILEHPKRHKMSHGIQLNYNTKEMNLKLIMCLQILAELAWRVKHKQEVSMQAVIEG